MKNIHIFFIVVMIQYTWDRSTSYCNTFKGEILLLFHHIFGVYLYLGWLFNPKYHLLVCIIVLLHWMIHKKCIITEITNKQCEYEKDKKFEDILRKLELYKLDRKIHWYLLFFIIFYDILLITKKI